MYILMISRGIPTKEYPQWGCFEQDQAEALQRNGHKVVVASVDSRFLKQKRKVGITHQQINGVDYYNSFWIPGAITGLLGKDFNLYIKNNQIDRIYKRISNIHGKPDVILGQFFFNTALGVFLKKKYGIPLVGIEHAGRFNNDVLDKNTMFLSTIAYKNIDKSIAVSETLKERLNFHFGIDSEVVHNLVSQKFVGKLVNDQKSDEFIFVSTGSLLRGKGFDVLINAFFKSKLFEKGARVIIIGDGIEKNNLQQMINELKLENYVTLAGRKSKDEIASILCNSKCFVLPSRGENFSVAILEALTVGLPVISTDCGGARTCINERNGFVVPIDDVDALSKALCDIYEKINRYNSMSIAKECEDNYSDKVITNQLVDVFNEAIEFYNNRQ